MIAVSVKGRIVVVVEIPLSRHTPQGVITHPNNCVPLLDNLRSVLNIDIAFPCQIPLIIVLSIPTVIAVDEKGKFLLIVKIPHGRNSSLLVFHLFS